MRAIKIDFVDGAKPLRALGFFLLVIALAIAGYAIHRYLEVEAELTAWEAKWRSLQKVEHKRTESGPIQKAELERLQTELKTATRIAERLSLPWDALFRDIESSVDEQVTLLSIEPDTEKREVRILAEAKTFNAMLDYVRRVQAISLFKNAHVTNHQIQQQDPQRPVRFVVNAQWLDILPQATPAARKAM
jgi:Tfp pilus assembly protein PilN